MSLRADISVKYVFPLPGTPVSVTNGISSFVKSSRANTCSLFLGSNPSNLLSSDFDLTISNTFCFLTQRTEAEEPSFAFSIKNSFSFWKP